MDIMHGSRYANRPRTLFAHNVLKHVKSHTPGRSIRLHCLDHKAKLTLTKSPPWIMKSFITLPKENSTHEQVEIKSQASIVFFFFLNKYFVITSYISASKMSSKTCIAVNMQLWFSFNYIIRSCYATFLLVAINIHKAFGPTSVQCNFAVKAIICIDNIKVRFELQRCVWLMKNLQHLSDGNKHKRQKFYT